MRLSTLKSILLSFGAYYVGVWLLHGPLVWVWSFVSNRLSFTVGIETIVLMPLVMGVPEIVVAMVVGAAIAATVDARHASRWALVPAALFVLQHVFARRWWGRSPTFEDQAAMVVEAALPVVACILAATVFESRLRQAPPNQALSSRAAGNLPDGRE